MTHASVFSGIGGPEVAASMLGWDNLFHCEINPFCRQILDYWYPNSASYEDITTTDFSLWQGKVDVLTGGFPCQPFSYAGKRRGSDDDRYLWPFMFKCIDQIRPTWVVAENVAGVTTMVEHGEISPMGGQATIFEEIDNIQRFRIESTFTIERICDDLESHGYFVQPVLIPACAVGAPHRRDRVFIVGYRRDAFADTDSERRSGRSAQDRRECPTERGQELSAILGIVEGQSGSNAPTDPRSGGQSASELDSERAGQTMDGQSGKQSLDGISGLGTSRNPADTDRNRGCEGDEHLESEISDGTKPVCNGRERNVADTTSGRSGELRDKSEEKRTRMRDVVFGNGRRLHGAPDELGSRWASFPSVSPIHRGNDGLPFDVDNLTISFSKWRTESLKAYGNAIVPQVMYEIFRAIEIVEHQTNKH